MGPVRQRQLIRLSSVLVALNLVVGLTVVYAHSTGAAAREAGGRVEAGAPPASGGPSTTAGSEASGGALAAGHFDRRRGSGTSSSTVPAPGLATTSPPPGAPITLAPGSTSSSAPPARTRPPATSVTAPGTDTTAPGTDATAPTTSAPRATTTTGKPAAGPPGSGIVTDATGDTFVDGTQTHITEPRADIVKAVAAYDNGNISFALETQKADDPRTDPNWSSDATYLAFDVDTTGDGKPDFEVQYAYDGTSFGGEVIHPGDDDSVPAVCDATAAGYTAPAYWVTIDPSCLGNPSSFSFRVTTYFDTNPKDDNADVASDVAPNGGMSFAITRP